MPTLIDGTEVDSYSEAWRHELEARRIAGQYFALRRETLEVIGIKRGQAEVQRLLQTIGAISDAKARERVERSWGPR